MKNGFATSLMVLLVSGCTNSSPLQPLVAVPKSQAQVAPTPSSNPLIDVDVNYCTTPSQQRAFKTKFVIVFDRSGSNQGCQAAVCKGVVPGETGIPGTDPLGTKRWQGIQTFVDSLSPAQKALYTFSLVYFSQDPATYPANYSGSPGIYAADMDRGAAKGIGTFSSATAFSHLLANENPYLNTSDPTLPKDGGATDFIQALKDGLQNHIHGYCRKHPPQPNPFIQSDVQSEFEHRSHQLCDHFSDGRCSDRHLQFRTPRPAPRPFPRTPAARWPLCPISIASPLAIPPPRTTSNGKSTALCSSMLTAAC